MDSNSKLPAPNKAPNVFMWIYSVFAWFVSPTYACGIWEKWGQEKKLREAKPAPPLRKKA